MSNFSEMKEHGVGEYAFSCDRAGNHRHETRLDRKPYEHEHRVTKTKKCECRWRMRCIHLTKDVDIDGKIFPPGIYISDFSKALHQNHIVNPSTQNKVVPFIADNTDYSVTDTSALSVTGMWRVAHELYEAQLGQDVLYSKLLHTYPAELTALQLTPRALFSKIRNQLKNMGGMLEILPSCDALAFVQKLTERRENEPGFKFIYQVEDKTKCFESAFWITANEIRNVGMYGVDIVVMDTTHHTNKHNLFLALFVMENKYGDTVTGGVGLLAYQDTESFSWLLKSFKEFTGVQPSVIMTDGDAAIAAAVRIEWQSTTHLLCIWHIIAKNVKSNMKPYLHEGNLRKLQNKLWAYSLKEDLNAIDRIGAEENEIINLIKK